MRMFSRRRGKKALVRRRAKPAAWVSARLRPCWAKRSGPKISERFGRSSGPRAASRIWPTSAGASGTSRSRSDAAIRSDDGGGPPEDEGDDDRGGDEPGSDEADHRVGCAWETEQPSARAVAAI